MAGSAGTVWEAQTVGASTNGGGFDPSYGGTDMSQGAATALSALSTAAANAVIVACASAAASWVGNYVYVTGGTNFSTGWYQIVSVVAGTSFTVDRTPTSAGAGAAGTANLGGPLDGPGTLGAALASAAGATSQSAFIKAGTYTVTAATVNVAAGCLSLPIGGTASAVVRIAGYDVVGNRSFNNRSVPLASRPVLQVNTGLSAATVIALPNATSSNVQIENMIINGASQTTSRGVNVNSSAARVRFWRITAENCANSGITCGAGIAEFIDCEVTGCTSAQQAVLANGSWIRCAIHDNAGGNVASNGSNIQFADSVLLNPGSGQDNLVLSNAGFVQLVNCILRGGRHGINVTAASTTAVAADVTNARFESLTGWGIESANKQDGVYVRNCSFYACTSGQVDTSMLTAANVSGSVSCSADPANNAGGSDYTLNNVAGGGALARGAGLPGTLVGLSASTGHNDVGAYQHGDPAAIPVVGSRIIRGLEQAA